MKKCLFNDRSVTGYNMSKSPGLHIKIDQGLLHIHREIQVDVSAVINMFRLTEQKHGVCDLICKSI